MSDFIDDTELVDFHYLLTLMPLLHDTKEFAWLPELFSIVGHESLIDLCRFAGGETIKIPTLEQLHDSINALNWYYLVYVSHRNSVNDIPKYYHKHVAKILESVKSE